VTITISLPDLLTLAIMALFPLAAYVIERCERYRELVDWILRTLNDD